MTAIEKVKKELESLNCNVMSTAKIKEECCPDIFLRSIAADTKGIKRLCATEQFEQCEECWNQEVED